MVIPAFGFSVGDFIAGTQILVKVISAFKEAGGASSKYAAEVSFLYRFKLALEHLEKHVNAAPQSELSQDISKLLEEIQGPWDEFRQFLHKYENSLGESSTKSKLGKAPRTIQYTVKDILGNVDKLCRQIERPLQAINSLLSLQLM